MTPEPTRLMDLIKQLPGEQRKGALIALDAISRPLTPREIENILQTGGIPKSRAIMFGSLLKRWSVVALVGPAQNERTSQ